MSWLIAAWVASGAWARVPALAARLPAPDAAAELARTTRALADDPIVRDKLEPEPDVVAAARAACRRTALATGPVDVRLDAMECAVNLGDATIAGLLLHVSDPEVRAGAAGLAPREELPDLVLLDPAPLAAAAAAAALCGADPAGAMARLGDEGRAKLRLLFANVGLDPGHRRAIQGCLRTK
ncbi:MAG TPA: hypothetical protein VKE22_11370 [Haliangiales bacterium]|nr:hypothetical protein [Haliangiales bacterium]